MINEMRRIVIAVVLLIPMLVEVGAMQIDRHDIDITSTDAGFSVQESIRGVVGENESSLNFSIQEGATNVVISINGQPTDYKKVGEVYTCNISIKNESSISITYLLAKDTKVFKKRIIYYTSNIGITYDENELFSGSDLEVNSYISASLILKRVEAIGIYIALLLLLIILIVVYIAKKRTSKPLEIETEEILKTKKALLMMLLKEIEKKHRNSEISDESYRYLKDRYKKEAVDVMKKLES
jgi:hypothetical protein